MIVLIPDHCLSIYFTLLHYDFHVALEQLIKIDNGYIKFAKNLLLIFLQLIIFNE